MLDQPVSGSKSQLPLTVTGLAFSAGGARLIDGLDLVLTGHGITVVMGPNGAGKSLLVRLLHGLIEPHSGSISWNGEPCGPATRLRQAMVFQKPVLLRRSVAANVDFVLKLKGGSNPQRLHQLLVQANLLDKAGQPARALSGGEQQRLALARALASDPEVLFLDEPTASLDPSSTQLIETAIAEASARGVKVVLVTHDAGQARRLANEIVFIQHGAVVEHSGAEAFFKQPASTAARDYLAGKLVI
ncbi:MAG: ATP-binding cassette domain-containing protein [Pseudomonadota bacterium]